MFDCEACRRTNITDHGRLCNGGAPVAAKVTIRGTPRHAQWSRQVTKACCRASISFAVADKTIKVAACAGIQIRKHASHGRRAAGR